MQILKKFWLDIVAIVAFIAISFAYFFPANIEGRILFQHDSAASVGLGQESAKHFEQTGEQSLWNGAVFCGMPKYQISPSYKSTQGLGEVIKAYHLWLPENVWYVFAFLLGFYIMLRAFNYKQHMAALGAIIWAFSSYFFIIIAAGHLWKVMALAYLPPMIGGIILAYRGKYLLGLALTAVFAAFEINANHVQMTYYFLFLILFLIIAFLAEAIKEKQLPRFFKATAVCVVAAIIGVGTNISNIYHTWEYSKESMRGKSELTQTTKEATNSGLSKDYITQWSYGIDETFTLLVPNTKGGASVPLAQNTIAQEKANPEFAEIYNQIGQYWGEQPGTSGPVYVGAFVLMLFILGIFIVKGPMKWALLAATILSILLSWGKNFMPLTDFFIDYIPMYSKFRTVASILVVAEFTIPLLAIMALKRIIDEPDLLKNKLKFVYISFGLTAGIAILFALMPSLFFSNFVSSSEMEGLKQLPSEYYNVVLSNLIDIRKSIFTADCWRTVFIIAIGTILLLLYRIKKLNSSSLIIMITILCLVDMWQVNKRYLNDGMFVSKSLRESPREANPTDMEILKDKSQSYRVLNLSTSTFNENETSYFHKSIGGYHAAKLRRYQDITDKYTSTEMQNLFAAISKAQGNMNDVKGDSVFPVLNMLNTKYFILPLQNGNTAPILNPYANGNAWFVSKINYVNNADEELNALKTMNLKHEAGINKQYESIIGNVNENDSTAKITLTKYSPDMLEYTYNTAKDGVVVFSEVYYPGWEATIDGKKVEIARANYVLRAIKVPAGSHKIVMTFDPKTISVTETIAYIAFIVMLGIVILYVYTKIKKQNKQEK